MPGAGRAAAAGLRGYARAPPAWALAAATAGALAVSFATKAPCAGLGPRLVPKVSCTSDVVNLFGLRGFDRNLVPYLHFNEYPPLTAGVQHLVAVLTDGLAAWFLLHALLLGAMAFGVTLVIHRLQPGSPWNWAWAAGPPLAWYAYINWDLPAVLLATAGVAAYLRGRTTLAGALLGAGFAAKWYPAVLGVVLLADLLRRHGARAARPWRFAGAAAGTALALHLPAALLAPSGLAEMALFHARRGAELESPWAVLRWAAHGVGWDGAAAFLAGPMLHVLTAATVAAVAAVAWQAWRGRIALLPALLAALLAFLLLNKVGSAQYVLWLMPLVALARAPWPAILLLAVADAAVFATKFMPIDLLADGGAELGDAAFYRAYAPEMVAVAVRTGAQLWLLAWCLRTRGAPDDAAAPGAHPTPH